MPAVQKTWRLHPHDPERIARFAASAGLSPVAAQLLLNRGVTNPTDARRFLDSPLSGLHAPELLPGAVEAAERLTQAMHDRKKICIYGDYDVDGLTGIAILVQLLALMDVPVQYHVPNRLEDGYGLRHEALHKLHDEGVTAVVTVDCGITSLEEAATARRLGIELIITDHHEPSAELPQADAVVHPRLPGGDYPFGGLSGSGVAFKLAWALCKKLSGEGDKVSPQFREFLVDAVALASLGLIADVVPLQDENRIFVKRGLNRLQHTPSIGLKALLESAGFADKAPLRAEDVAFRIAPRLNAAGRLGCARLVVDLLTTASVEKARQLAAFLDNQNKERQLLERRIAREARERLEGTELPHALVLDDPQWHPGVIGIVASRLVDTFARPALLISSAFEPAPGSGRSIPGFALHQALAACSQHLLSYGGHAAAAGFKIARENIPAFRKQFCEYAANHFPRGIPPPTLDLDAEVPLSALTLDLMREIEQLEPYGASNPRPKFLAGGLELVGEPKKIGGGERHLNFRVRQGGTALRAIAFGMADRLEALTSGGGACCLAFTPRINEWNGYRSVEIEVSDFQPGPTAQLA